MYKFPAAPYSEENLRELNKKLGTSIRPDLLKVAISTHQAQNEHPGIVLKTNEKLELLGDSVLKLVIAENLYEKEENEAEITIVKSKIENNRALAVVGHELGIKQHLFLGGTEKLSAGKGEGTLLADALEALIGALYKDQGLSEAKKFIERLVMPRLLNINDSELKDPVTRLQEYSQRMFGSLPQYLYTRLPGPDHEPRFRAEVSINGEAVAVGEGGSKKEAGLDAAIRALSSLNID